MRRVTTRMLSLSAGLVLGLLGLAGPAAAHDSLVDSQPGRGAALATSPTEVSLTFNAVVSNPTVIVADSAGNAHQRDSATTTDKTVTQSVNELPSGQYLINYRVVSSDGHPISGQVPFTVGPPGDNQLTVAPPGQPGDAALASDTGGVLSDTAWYLIGGGVMSALVGFLIFGTRIRRGGDHAA